MSRTELGASASGRLWSKYNAKEHFDGFQCPSSIINVNTMRLTCAATITRQEDIDHTGIIKFFRLTVPTLMITSNGQAYTHEFIVGYLKS
jgi:hypothetical protein